MKSSFPLRLFLLATWLAMLGEAFALLPHASLALAQAAIPPTSDVLADDFESGTLDKWQLSSPTHPALAPGDGYNGSTGLSVNVSSSSSYIYQTQVAKAEEGYLSFWFNPSGVSIPDQGTSWVPGKSLSIAEVVNSTDGWPPLVALYVRRPTGQGYQAYLAWPSDATDQPYYDYDNAFVLVDGWQHITIGYRVNEWVAVWCNGELKRYATNVVHTHAYGDTVRFGNVGGTSNNPSGAIRLDEVAFLVPRLENLWVDAVHGNDANAGMSSAAAFRTIQKAADMAGPGTTVHILPGVYRETVWPALSGSDGQPVVYQAENGPGTAIIRGSEPSASLSWTQLAANSIGLPAGVDPTKIYFTDLSAWNLSVPPRFIVQLDANGQVIARLPLAREPDWQVTTDWKYAEFWWAAEGGSSPAACDPTTNADNDCDLPQRSTTQLTDRTNDTDPPGVETGNLTTLGDLTGATLVAMDTVEGHYVYRRTITAHDVVKGLVTVDHPCEFDSGSGNPGLGWGTKYYVEGKPQLLDNPGEWWYDATTKRLYLWPPTSGNPAALNIEISRRDNGFSLQDRSYVTLDGLTIEFVNQSAVHQRNWITEKSYHNTVRNAVLRYANYGAFINQEWRIGAPPQNLTDGFTLEDSTIAYIDNDAIRLLDQWDNDSASDSFTRSGILNTVIRNNEMHHLGFRPDVNDSEGLAFTAANKLRFEGNHVHDVAHNAVVFDSAVIQSSKTYGFAPSEIKTGDILILNNIIERACELATDCGAVKFWGYPPDNHVYRDVLITGNIFRDTVGWTYISEKRQLGASGFGLFLDYASGIHAYRNIAYNNAYAGYYFYGTWRDGDIVYYNNIAANSLYGMVLGAPNNDTHGSVNTQLVDNIIVNNEYYGITISSADGNYPNTAINHNLYFNDGWNTNPPSTIWKPGDMMDHSITADKWYQTLSEIKANTSWEAQGMEGDPAFWSYNPADHDLHDGSWPDFHLTAASINAIDKGTTTLPASLTALLNKFGVDDWHAGTAYDIGRYEGGFELLADPPGQVVEPGGTARYSLRVDPSDLPYAVTLTVASPSPDLTVALSPTVLAPGATATLAVTDAHTGALESSLLYTVPITASGGGFTQTGHVMLLVGGVRVYLPLVLRN